MMLMDYLIGLKYKAIQLENLNRCRVFLQVLKLSDKVSADGKSIFLPTLNGYRLTDRRTTLTWPMQQRPSKAAWSLWPSAKKCLHQNRILHKPLTEWLVNPHQNWFWYMDPNNSAFYHILSPSEWQPTTPLPLHTDRQTRSSHRRLYNISQLHKASSPPNSNLLPVTLQETDEENTFTAQIGSNPILP
jgi:hypothetical protein